MDKPEFGKVYSLTGGSSTKSIANGNTWAESEYKPVSEKTLTNIAEMTERNYHTEARLLISKQFAYCRKYQTLFEAIKTITDIEGKIPFGIVAYREDITNDMLEQIKRTEGQKTFDKISSCL